MVWRGEMFWAGLVGTMVSQLALVPGMRWVRRRVWPTSKAPASAITFAPSRVNDAQVRRLLREREARGSAPRSDA